MPMNEKQGSRWFRVIMWGFVLATICCSYMIGKTSVEKIDEPTRIIQAESNLVLQYRGENFIIGVVDTTTGQVRLNDDALTLFVLMQSKDKGIREAATAIGPPKVDLIERNEE